MKAKKPADVVMKFFLFIFISYLMSNLMHITYFLPDSVNGASFKHLYRGENEIAPGVHAWDMDDG